MRARTLREPNWHARKDAVKYMVDEKLFCEILRGAGAKVHERSRRASCAAHGGDNDQAVSWRVVDWEDGPATDAKVVRWYCFTGDHGGDIITFVREAYKMEFMDAVVALEETIREAGYL